MEDAATAEISRTQIWQWLKNSVQLEDGRCFNMELYESIFKDEVYKIVYQVGEINMHHTKFDVAIKLFDKLVIAEEFEEFLTLPAYLHL